MTETQNIEATSKKRGWCAQNEVVFVCKDSTNLETMNFEKIE